MSRQPLVSPRSETVGSKQGKLSCLLSTDHCLLAPKAAGFTLFELMVVVSVVSILLGLGVTVLTRLSYRWGFESNIMRAQAIIRGARNFSLTSEAPSEVHVVPRENRIFAMGEKTVAQWHFEGGSGDETEGAFGINGRVVNATVVQGKTGYGLEFGQNPGIEDSYVDCGNVPVFSPPAGIVIDLWIYPGNFRGARFAQLVGAIEEEPDEESPKDEEELEEEARRKAQNEITLRQKYDSEQRFTIIFKEDSYFLSLTQTYALEFAFADPKNYYPLRTLDNVVTPNAWNHIVLRYSGRIEYPPEKVKVYVNNVPLTIFYIEPRGAWSLHHIAEMPTRKREGMLPPRPPVSDGNLFISAPQESFYGAIDEVRIGAIVDPEVDRLDSAFLMGYPQVIHFDSQGRLDPEYHEAYVIVKLTENPLYKAPEPETEEVEYVTRAGGIHAPVSAQEAESGMKLSTEPPEMHKHAIITINKYGGMKLTEVTEEEKKEEEE